MKLSVMMVLAMLFVSIPAVAVSYVFPAPKGQATPVVTIDKGRGLSASERKYIENLISDTFDAIDNKDPNSALAVVNNSHKGKLPSWLFDAISRCETWFLKTEGNISCRNGALFRYWDGYISGAHDLSRREARRLARVARIADVDLQKQDYVSFAPTVQWDMAGYGSALVIERIARYLASLPLSAYHISVGDIDSYHSSGDIVWHADVDGEAMAIQNGAIAKIRPWQRSAFSNKNYASNEKGVISHSDGWPSAQFQVVSVAPNALEALLIATLSATKPAQESLELINAQQDFDVKLSDENGRVFTSEKFGVHNAVSNRSDTNELTVDITLPFFDIVDYRGPYVSVWLSDDTNHLVKSLALRGSNERWLNELRTWWRRIGRKNESLIDGFAGATKKNKPLHLVWDGKDDFGKKVTTASLFLNVEVARENGGRSYKKVPVSLTSSDASADIDVNGEIESITISTHTF